MSWCRIPALALDIDSGIAAARALAISQALMRRVLPLLLRRDGRIEPLASGALYWLHGRLLLLTCSHAFDDGATLGDLAVPVGDGALLWLRDAAARLMPHTVDDLAAIDIVRPAAQRRLLQHWRALPLPTERIDLERVAQAFVVMGYPYAQMQRRDGIVHAQPLVFFARRLVDASDARISYARIGRHLDGVVALTPPLDGVSGATLWAITAGDGDVDCVLHPAALQIAFNHSAYARGDPLGGLWELARRARRG